MRPISSNTTAEKANGSTREGGQSNVGTTPVLNPKQPKVVPQIAFGTRLGFLYGRLPKYSGPYSVRCPFSATLCRLINGYQVGTMEIEVSA